MNIRTCVMNGSISPVGSQHIFSIITIESYDFLCVTTYLVQQPPKGKKKRICTTGNTRTNIPPYRCALCTTEGSSPGLFLGVILVYGEDTLPYIKCKTGR